MQFAAMIISFRSFQCFPFMYFAGVVCYNVAKYENSLGKHNQILIRNRLFTLIVEDLYQAEQHYRIIFNKFPMIQLLAKLACYLNADFLKEERFIMVLYFITCTSFFTWI